MRNSPKPTEIETVKPIGRWRKVSIKDIDIDVPRSAPVEALGRTFAFGRLESEEEVVAPGAEGKTAEGNSNGDGDRYGDDGDGDSIMSGGSIDSI